VAACAFLAAPARPEDVERARQIADAFVELVRHERGSNPISEPECPIHEAFIRNAYSCGDLIEWHEPKKTASSTAAKNSANKRRTTRLPGWEARFKLTDKSLTSLRSEAVPEAVLSKLNSLKDQEFETQNILLRKLTHILSNDDLEKFQICILKHANEGSENDSIPWYEDAYSKGIDSGNMAWTALALLNVWNALGSPNNSPYLTTAEELANSVIKNCDFSQYRQSPEGFTGGFEWDPKSKKYNRCGWLSTEHNIDLAVVFKRLALVAKQQRRLEDSDKYERASRRAMNFVEWAADPSHHKEKPPLFLVTGTLAVDLDKKNLAVIEPSLGVQPLDPQTWSVLAFLDTPLDISPDERDRFVEALNWAVNHCRVPRTIGVNGFTYSFVDHCLAGSPDEAVFGAHHRDVWPEGTAQVMLALRSLQQSGRATSTELHGETPERVAGYLDAIYKMSQSQNLATGGMPAAYPSQVDQGFTKYGKMVSYRNFPHVGATAWYIMAKRGRGWNPFWGTPIGDERRSSMGQSR
jgi:hypothetical protein